MRVFRFPSWPCANCYGRAQNVRRARPVAPAEVETQRERTIPAGRGMPAERFLRHRGLIALAVCGASAQACLLAVLAPGARSLAPQITAIPPLAVFYDLRWLFGSNRAWDGFVLMGAALVLARAAVSTVLIRLAWPRDLPRPRWGATFGRCVVFTVLAGVLLSPVVTLLFGVSLLPFSWPYLAALPVLLLISIPLAHGGLLGSWWRTLPPPRAVGWLLASFVVLSLAAAAIVNLPPAAAGVVVAGLAGRVDPGQADETSPALTPGASGDPVSGDALSELVKMAGALSPFGASGAQNLIESVRADGAAFAAAAVRNGQHIHWLAVVPLADAVTLPVCELPSDVVVVPALHGSLLGDFAIDRMAHRFLTDEDVAGPQRLRDTAEVIAAAAEAWRMPVLGTRARRAPSSRRRHRLAPRNTRGPRRGIVRSTAS
jgi:hypothetical protein